MFFRRPSRNAVRIERIRGVGTRGVLIAGLLLCFAALGVSGAETGTRFASFEALRAARRQAADRPRRIIFNNDGSEPVYLCQTTSAAELLGYRTAPLAGTHVDTIFYCTWSSGFGLFTHDTKVGEVFATREGLFSGNLAPALLAAGTDPLRVMADFGRKQGIEIFWSFRLNDTHDGSTADYGPIMFRANRLKREHPEWLIGSPGQKPKLIRIPRLNPASPVALEPGATHAVTFQAGAFQPPSASSAAPRIRLRLQFTRPPSPDALTVLVNGTAVKEAGANGTWLEFAVPPGTLRPGTNHVGVTLAAKADAASLSDLHSSVRFGAEDGGD